VEGSELMIVSSMHERKTAMNEQGKSILSTPCASSLFLNLVDHCLFICKHLKIIKFFICLMAACADTFLSICRYSI
jgi:hypothetical protein